MANPGQIDHVEAGLAEVPEKLRKARIQTYLSVYLRQFNTIETMLQAVIDAFVNWRTPGAQRTFVLEIIGALLGQPRPEDFDNQDYAFVLQARVLVRRSEATRDDVLRVARFLAGGRPVEVLSLAPKIVIVQFTDVVLTPQWEALYAELLTGAIDAVDKLVVTYATSATAGYDFGEYDTELYGP